MSGQSLSQTDKAAFYRIDRFTVPATGYEEFMSRVRQTHAVLKRQPGFIRDHIVERPLPAGFSEIATIAEWQTEDHVASAKVAVRRSQLEAGFDPQEMLGRLEIEAAIASYAPSDP